MKIFSNYSKWLLPFVLASLLGAGCATNDGGSPTSAVQEHQQSTIAAPGFQSELGQAIAIQNRHTDALMRVDGVVGTGTGIDQHGSPIIYIFTSKPGVGNIPSSLEDVPTNIEYVGEVKALKGFKGSYRNPMWSGVSVGNNNECSAGTIGCVVTDGSQYYLLSNNHVFARENNAAIGESIVQPGRYDTRCRPSSQVASLSQFATIDFSGANNTVDAAIAEIDGGINSTSRMAVGTYLPSSTTQTATVGMAVKKTGRTTGLTQGTVKAINVTINVSYGSGTARFVSQIAIGSGGFSNSGDSGSLIVESSSNEPVGLLFAGGGGSTFANPIDNVLNALGVTIVSN